MPNPFARAKECRSARSRHRIAEDWLQPVAPGNRRSTTRSHVGIEAQFRPRWRRRFPVEVDNLSTQGCRITGPGQLVVGTYSWIVLPTLESRYARVAWCNGAAAGLDFTDPLHRAVAEMIVEQAAR